MTAARTGSDPSAPVQPDPPVLGSSVLGSSVLGSSVLGSSVVAVGAAAGGDAIALWNLGPTGVATGAWVVDHETAVGDPDTARRLLTCLDGRALTGTDPTAVTTVLRRLTGAAGLEVPDGWWGARSFTATDAFAEVLRRRAELDASVERRRASANTAAALEWSREFTDVTLPRSSAELRAVSSIGAAPGEPAVSEALTLARVLRWLVDLWAETEQPKGRRDYLREAHGAVEPLPPTWRAATTTAAGGRLPL